MRCNLLHAKLYLFVFGATFAASNWHLLAYVIKIIYPRGIGPTYELYSSSRRTAVVPLLKKNYMQFFWLFFGVAVLLVACFGGF